MEVDKVVALDEPPAHLRLQANDKGKYPPIKIISAKVTRDLEEKDAQGSHKSKG